ncbi:MAG: hypothetical protein Q8M31_06485 [Beijerinckiaceae bacterium]|nr:hypothetical protein [Beijerinckiaceae bacterium]
MSRNTLMVVVGLLAVLIGVIGYQLYQERQKTSGIEITIGERGISVEKK